MSEGGPDLGGASSDVYTVLTVVSSLFLLLGIIILAMKSQQLFDSWLPMGGV